MENTLLIKGANIIIYLYKFVIMESRPVKIFTSSNVPRLRYIAEIILGDILGLNWEMVTDRRKLGKNPVINYSSENITGSFKINPDTLLFEESVKKREITTSDWKGLPVFFQTTSDSDLPFDIFASSFFLISRYEEYLELEHDEYGRFRASSSVAYRNGFLDLPVVDLWTKEFAKALLRKFQTLVFKRNKYEALITIDVDEPFAYLGKGVFASLGGFINDIADSQKHVSDRYDCVAKGKKDPYDVFDYIIETIEKSNTDVRFFISTADRSEFDKNPSWMNEEYRKLINSIADKLKIGLHPSFRASDNESLLKTEVDRLRSILQKDVRLSRFHYLRILMPDSYRNLINAGITEDYSMGYPEEPGFRAGLARPFFFYNIVEEKQSNLRIIPFQIMDVTLSDYKKLEPDSSRGLILKAINETKRVGGVFVSIWHNTSLLDNQECRGWREVFEFMLKNQKPLVN